MKSFIEKACDINEYERMSRSELAEFLAKNSDSNPEEACKLKTKESEETSTSENNPRNEQKILRNCGSTPKLTLPHQDLFKNLEKKKSCKVLKIDHEST